MVDNVVNDENNQPKAERAGFWVTAKSYLPSFSRLGILLGGLIAALFILIVGWSFYQTSAAVDDYVPKSWNTAIEKLGITPVYPPQEDLYVGDVLLAVSPSTRKFKNFPEDLRNDAMIGRSIKIGHIDLTTYMKRPDGTRYFGDTTVGENGALAMAQPRLEVPFDPSETGKVALTSVLFPAITLERAASASGVLNSLGLAVAARSAEKIVLSHVQSYGADAYPSLVKLSQFCIDVRTRGFCIQNSARAQLSYLVGDDILRTAETSDGGRDYVFGIRIFLVYRAYLARGIEVGGADGVDAKLFSSEPSRVESSEETQGSTSTPRSSGSGGPVVEVDAKATEDPSSVRGGRGSSRTYWVNDRFNRPLVFGYRSVSMGMREKP